MEKLPVHRDGLYQSAIGAIAEIEPREWPKSPLHALHESYREDIRMVERFCKDKRVHGRSWRYVDVYADVLFYLKPDYALYCLPAILLACLQYPVSIAPKFVVNISRLDRNSSRRSVVNGIELALFTHIEKRAFNAVVDYCRTDSNLGYWMEVNQFDTFDFHI